MKAIVTGANGYIGSNLINKLVENGIEVAAVDFSFASPKFKDCGLVQKIEKPVNELTKEEFEGEYDLFFDFAWGG